MEIRELKCLRRFFNLQALMQVLKYQWKKIWISILDRLVLMIVLNHSKNYNMQHQDNKCKCRLKPISNKLCRWEVRWCRMFSHKCNRWAEQEPHEPQREGRWCKTFNLRCKWFNLRCKWWTLCLIWWWTMKRSTTKLLTSRLFLGFLFKCFVIP